MILILILIFLLIPTCLCAMEEDNELDHGSLKKPLLQGQKSHRLDTQTQEDNKGASKRNKKNPLNYLCCYGNMFSWLNVVDFIEKNLLKRGQNGIKTQLTNIYSLPKGVILYTAEFLESPDILRLSGSCKKFREFFNENYWIIYLSKKPMAHSYLTLNNPLSSSLSRKAFFSNLWYREDRLSLAARLNHPESIILKKFSTYGVYINKDQYLCSSGAIRYISGQIDYERTEKLKEAEKKKAREEMEKHERLRSRGDNRGINYSNKFNLSYKNYN
jgi:hypothetical protein